MCDMVAKGTPILIGWEATPGCHKEGGQLYFLRRFFSALTMEEKEAETKIALSASYSLCKFTKSLQ